MKRVLITGAHSFIGSQVEMFLNRFSREYLIDTLDMTDINWTNHDFSPYDCVFHVAGIAHSDSGRISKEKETIYYAVNTDLALETARQAKLAGVHQFIFMSSMIVFGESSRMGHHKHITFDTIPSPSNAYGDSKLKAEIGLHELSSDDFRVCIIRPPMIYGPGCKGNYPSLRRIALISPLFPSVKNERSMLFVQHLTRFVKYAIDTEAKGTYHPQNKDYVTTTELTVTIAKANGKKLYTTRLFNPFLKLMSTGVGLVNKAFGSLTYDQSMSDCGFDYAPLDFLETIQITEAKNE